MPDTKETKNVGASVSGTVTKETPLKADNGGPAPSVGAAGASNDSGKSFLDVLYDEISEVIGGDSPDQYFCLSFPGTLLNPDDYSYDTSGEKPAHVKANESKLANKMFDACFVAAADNGKHLSDQYRTALNMLSPKLNRDLFEMKVRLREVLMTPYPYDFGDGTEDTMTLEQVFYRLYGEYVDAKEAWNQKQADKKAELKRTVIDPNERKDAYLEWYGLIAEAEQVALEEKLGRVLNVFSPSDMNIINAILNCGVGGEVENARSAMEMVEEMNPDGSYVYPVNLYPSNWFKLLDSSFTGVDLLESPAALSHRLHLLEMQRNNIMLNISKLTSTLPSDADVHELEKKYEEADASFRKLQDECTKQNISTTVDVLKTVVALYQQTKGAKGTGTPSAAEVKRVAGTGKDGKEIDVGPLIDVVGKGATECLNAQTAAVDAAGKSTKAALAWCEAKNKHQLKELLTPLKAQLETVNIDIEELKEQIAISRAVLAEPNNQDGKQPNSVADVLPNQPSDGFTQVLIQSKMSSIKQSSSRSSEASSSRRGASFFFGGHARSKSHQESVEAAMSDQSDMEIQIGMNIAKVQIEREWFNPGVFLLTGNMFSFTENSIAPINRTSFADGASDAVKTRFSDMNKCIFPSYPEAFVIAKDVSIRFTSATSVSSSFAQSVEDHASKGGGFFIFSGSSSKSSGSSSMAATANSNANSVTIRFTTPQILGYYMQATPADRSVHINRTNSTDAEMSVISFVSKFKEMLADYNRTLQKNKHKADDGRE